MAFPDNVDTVTVTWGGDFITPNGVISGGSVDFTPIPSRVKAGGSIVQGTVTRSFDVGNVELLATDSDNIDPSNFKYQVYMKPALGEPYRFNMVLPKSNASVTLASLVPAGSEVLPRYATLVDPSSLGAVGFTVAEFLAQPTPWYLAHRGSGAELAPEHTIEAYRNAVSAGANAIEVSVHAAADGTLFCLHDDTFDRTTNKTGNANTLTYPAIRNLVRNKAKGLLGTGWTEDMHPPLLSEVLSEFAGRAVIFLEAKSNDSVVPVQTMLSESFPDANQYIVWKNYYQSNSFDWAKANDFVTWAYLDAGTTDSQMDAVESNVDIWGLPKAMSQQRMIDVLNRAGGKPAICWEVHRRFEATYLRALTGTGTKKAVDGLMCANFAYLNRSTAIHTTDDWATQVKAPGDLPNGDYDATFALQFDTNGEVYCPALSGASNGLHSFAPIVAGSNGYKIQFKMRYPLLPATGVHGGIFFGKASDDQYTFSSTNNKTGGYHVLLRGNGDFQIYTHTAGVASGTQLANINAGTILANTVYSFEVEINATQVIARALDTPTVRTLTVSDTTYRGRYWGIHNGSITDATTIPRFRTGVIVQT